MHRVPGSDRSSVFAVKQDLDRWLLGESECSSDAKTSVQVGARALTAAGLWDQCSTDNLDEILVFHRAWAREEQRNASAHAGLANVLLLASYFNLIEGSVALLQARSELLRAQLLDPELAATRCAGAWLAFWQDRNVAEAQMGFASALERDPNCWFARLGQAWLYSLTGDSRRASLAAEHLLEATGFSSPSATAACSIHFHQGEFQKALWVASQGIASRSGGRDLRVLHGLALLHIGESAQAVAMLEREVAASAEQPMLVGYMGYAYGLVREQHKALNCLGLLERMSNRQVPGCSFPLALVCLSLGREQDTLDWLEHGVRENCFYCLGLGTNTILHCLSSDARFERLARAVQVPLAQARRSRVREVDVFA